MISSAEASSVLSLRAGRLAVCPVRRKRTDFGPMRIGFGIFPALTSPPNFGVATGEFSSPSAFETSWIFTRSSLVRGHLGHQTVAVGEHFQSPKLDCRKSEQTAIAENQIAVVRKLKELREAITKATRKLTISCVGNGQKCVGCSGQFRGPCVARPKNGTQKRSDIGTK